MSSKRSYAVQALDVALKAARERVDLHAYEVTHHRERFAEVFAEDARISKELREAEEDRVNAEHSIDDLGYVPLPRPAVGFPKEVKDND